MPLKKVRFLNYASNYTYAPPQEDAVINTDDVQSVRPTEARGTGPFVLVSFRNGNQITCVGTVDDFV